METIIWSILLLAPVTSAGCIDWRSRIIPNWLNLLIFCLGIAWQTAAHRPGDALLGAALGLAVGLVPSLFVPGKGIGGGDLKMMAAIGAWYGPLQVLMVLLVGGLTAVTGGLFSLIRAKRLRLWICSLPFKNRERLPEEIVPFGTCLAFAIWAYGIFLLLTTGTIL